MISYLSTSWVQRVSTKYTDQRGDGDIGCRLYLPREGLRGRGRGLYDWRVLQRLLKVCPERVRAQPLQERLRVLVDVHVAPTPAAAAA